MAETVNIKIHVFYHTLRINKVNLRVR